MSDASIYTQQRGIALALLLWMLAAMSLTVAAVVHFSQGDVSMTTLRVQESKLWWLGRGLVEVAVRDQLLENNPGPGLEGADEVADTGLAGSVDENGRRNVNFTREYALNDLRSTVTLYPANGYVSLASASSVELTQFFQSVGELDVNSAMLLADEVVAYRDEAGPVTFAAATKARMRFVEELLLVPGVSRLLYDRVRPWVHAIDSGAFDPAVAPRQLGDAMGVAASMPIMPVMAGPVTGRGSARQGVRADRTPTFDAPRSMGQNVGARLGSDSVIAHIEFVDDQGGRFEQRIEYDTFSHRAVRIGEVRRLSRD